MRDFIILVAHFSNHDAVCNDAVSIGEYLTKAGHNVFYFSPSADLNFRKPLISRERFRDLASLQQTIVIYEHCIYMASYSDLFSDARCQIWLRYQNITPPKFYDPYDSVAAHATRAGLAQTQELVADPRVSMFLPGSEFTAKDLVNFGAKREKIEIIAPISRVDDFDKCSVDQSTQQALTANPKINNLLFVGRVVPNKGHKHLLQILKSYLANHGPDVHLWIVGGLMKQYGKYYLELEEIVNRNKLGSHVTFTGPVSFDALHTFYKFSDVFLLMSEHEGFCVPITEAQYHGLPIVAVDHGPFQDAIGQDQLIVDHYDYPFLAAACARIKKDENLRQTLSRAGKENLKLFRPAALNGKIGNVVARFS